MHNYDWDDLKYVLAVVDHGSVSAAARSLRVNHATVLRRIAMFEDKCGVHLFDKSPRGYVLPPENLQLIDTMRDVETAALAVERQIAGEGNALRGTVRITSTDTFCHCLLPHLLPRIRKTFPKIQFDLLCSNAHVDLSRMEADITLRPALSLPDHLEGEQVGILPFGVYHAPACCEDWIGLSGALTHSAAARWMSKHVASDQICAVSDSFLTMRELVAARAGRAILPCMIAERDPRMSIDPRYDPQMSVPIWIASHRDLAQTPRIASVRQGLSQAIRKADEVTL